MSEADTCRKFVVPKLQAAGWDNEPHSIAEQRTITDRRIVPVGKGFVRKPPKRVDYLLNQTRDFPIAVVEAKAAYTSAADGMQQAKTYAEMLGLRFAYATNGFDILKSLGDFLSRTSASAGSSSESACGIDRKQALEIREDLLRVLLEALHGGGEPVMEAGEQRPPSSQSHAVIGRLEDRLDSRLQSGTAVGDHEQRRTRHVRRRIPGATPSRISSENRTSPSGVLWILAAIAAGIT